MIAKTLVFFLISIFLPIDSKSISCYLDAVRIIFYYGPTFNDRQFYKLKNAASILKHPKFNHNQTNLYIHGYMDNQKSDDMLTTVDAYLKRNSINLLVLEWTLQVNGAVTTAQYCALQLAPKIAKSILQLFDAGVEEDSFILVGHSLGAPTAGAAAQEVIKQSNGSVILPKLICMDPANPKAFPYLPPISKIDAKFVQVIHSDAGVIGTPEHSGHADFWPNGGTAIQPGCPPLYVNPQCSHLKSIQYFTQSVAKVHQEQLLAYKAQSYQDYLENGGEKDTAMLMGIDCPTSASGDYYLQINSDFDGASSPKSKKCTERLKSI